ncbi:MAG: HAD family hydrolase [Candidatus Binatia bacterium]
MKQDFPTGDTVRLIILDCDGVLFDSRDANVAFYDSVLAELGVAPLDEIGRDLCHRLSGPQLWDHLFASDAALHARARKVASRADYDPFYPLMRPVLDLDSTLAHLSSHCPLALATNRGRTVEGVTRYFGLDRFVMIRLGILDVERPKPAPDLLLACLARARVPAEAAVFVGDTLVDRDAALAANVAYVGVGFESGAERTIDDLRALPDLLGISRKTV